jgi:hypothetical protein
MWIVIHELRDGDGSSHYGPFDSIDAANDWGDKNIGPTEDWFLMELIDPTE